MYDLDVNLPAKNYPLIIEKGILNNIGSKIKDFANTDRIAIITDSNILNIYGKKVEVRLKIEGYKTKIISVEAGETSKSFKTLLYLYNELLDFKIKRDSVIIALGGGVIGDLAGFCASTLLRGIRFIQIPTSLLAQIDSSIGGKVAVNLPKGKNLVGSFYHPNCVFIDPEVLNTLPKRHLYDGMAEVIKYGCIKDKDLFNKLNKIKDENDLLKNIDGIIYTCCNIKKYVVEKDEKDTGLRMILNFGHTIGHAIEKYYDYNTYTHGEAVAIGMYKITQKSEALNLTKKSTAKMIKDLLIKFNLPYDANIDNDRILDSIGFDKKNIGSFINLILLEEIGSCFIEKVMPEDIVRFV
jgi:3-dehydroquinate synthase